VMISSKSVVEKKVKYTVFTIEECPVDGQKTKREFQIGDYVTKDGAKCTKCGNQTRISLIYAETLKPPK
jgi:rRNA maturation protein Nop10